MIPELGALGGSILGDTFAPTPQQQQAQQSKEQAEFARQQELKRMAQMNAIRRSTMPGMYTALGYSPQMGQQMTSQYSQSAAGMPGGQPGPGKGKKIAKGILGAALQVAPALI